MMDVDAQEGEGRGKESTLDQPSPHGPHLLKGAIDMMHLDDHRQLLSTPPAQPLASSSLLTPPTPASRSRRSYTPQFSSAAAQAILERFRTSRHDDVDGNSIAEHDPTSIVVGGSATPPSEAEPRTMPMPVRKKRGRRRGGHDGDNITNINNTAVMMLASPAPSSPPSRASSYAGSVSSGVCAAAARKPVCTVCERPARSTLNPLVSCCGCRRRWHRLCHDPVIADHVAAAAAAGANAGTVTANGVLENENGVDGSGNGVETRIPDTAGAAAAGAVPSSGWSCPACTAAAAARHTERLARRACAERPPDALHVPARPPPPTHHDLSRRTPQQRRAYLARLARPDLQAWLLYAMAQHPDLAVYPPLPPMPPTPKVDAQPTAATAAMAGRASGHASSHASRGAQGSGPRRGPGRPPRGFLPPLPSLPASGRVAMSAVYKATSTSPTFRQSVIKSLRHKHRDFVAAAEAAERAARIAAGLPVKRKRGRPPKVRQVEDERLLLLPQEPSTAVSTVVSTAVSTAQTPLAGQAGQAAQTARPTRPRLVDPAHIPAFVPTPIDPDEEDPTGLMAGWPKPGQGLYARLGPDWLPSTASTNGDNAGQDNTGGDALVDSNDHASFSSMVFSGGRKIMENGQPVLVL
ncbi:uncharacterized protein SPSK_06099 [Sporothrix schenckii 1099-18]|uniref:Zinc finger PHD-type domain-containing protein n=1 Tax=Sporothrix schenckii 1099-18 TaxID=1397361 RepID=A0A0F2MLV9_SPOSC|nr:uncharacterized protein SPSK_06099 [Sporothrix schenckii 1099-18]KJR90019.1 hypothetical protein SPSK_06099 [Sporothrix schenckii 1099-18]